MKIENIIGVRKNELERTRITFFTAKISDARAQEIRERYPSMRIVNFLAYGIKVEKPIEKRYTDVKAIRVYIAELMKNINSTIERGENPYLLIKKAHSLKRGVNEIEIVFMGSKEKHIEELTYFKKHPKDWTSWGEIVLSTEQAEEFIEALKAVLEAKKTKQQKLQA